jgi:hypothetical protein
VPVSLAVLYSSSSATHNRLLSFWQRTSCKTGLHVFWALKAENGFLRFKDIVQPKKRGGQEGYHSIRLNFLHNRLCFLDTLKGLIFCFKFKKTSISV